MYALSAFGGLWIPSGSAFIPGKTGTYRVDEQAGLLLMNQEARWHLSCCRYTFQAAEKEAWYPVKGIYRNHGISESVGSLRITYTDSGESDSDR